MPQVSLLLCGILTVEMHNKFSTKDERKIRMEIKDFIRYVVEVSVQMWKER